MSGKRTDRLAHQLRDEISQILQRGEIKDPRLGFASITAVRLSKDLRHARVFVSVFGSELETTNSMAAITNAQGYVRRLLSQRLKIRHVPELGFLLDQSIEEGIRMNKLLSELPEFQNTQEDAEEQNNETPSEEDETPETHAPELLDAEPPEK